MALGMDIANIAASVIAYKRLKGATAVRRVLTAAGVFGIIMMLRLLLLIGLMSDASIAGAIDVTVQEAPGFKPLFLGLVAIPLAVISLATIRSYRKVARNSKTA